MENFKILVLYIVTVHAPVLSSKWEHNEEFDKNFIIFWNISEYEIEIEMQVKTQGLIGIGFARQPLNFGGMDIVIGWAKNNHFYFQASKLQL